jgi:hypothetical protein
VTDRRHRALVRLALAEGCWGAALLLFATPLLGSVAGEPVARKVVNVARVLGARQLLQGVMTVRWPTRVALEAGAATDALHAVTMVVSAAAKVGPRRLTLASAATAGAFSAAGIAQSRSDLLSDRAGPIAGPGPPRNRLR